MISTGNQTIQDFFDFMNERHAIWIRRQNGAPWPWTEDKILQEFKFTNVYRQLDKTTIAFNENITTKHDDNLEHILFNVVWFRMFGWIELTDLGFCTNPRPVVEFINARAKLGLQVFTGAYMSAGASAGGIAKHTSYLESVEAVYEHLTAAVKYIQNDNTMFSAYRWLLTVPFIGPFYAYEMACDLRFTPLLSNAADINTWANVGPGAARGLLRLGLQPKLSSMVGLLEMAPEKFEHYYTPCHKWPFELREIEHSLCEFDKYVRVKLNEGRPKERYVKP